MPKLDETEMGGSMALVNAEPAARDIVHFAMLDENGPTGGLFRFKKLIPW